MHARPRSGGRESSRRTHQLSRARSYVHSDTGFELAGVDLPLRPETQPPGPHLQRITRSPRSRPSLHGSAWKHAQWRRTCTRILDRARKLGCGTWTGDLGDSGQAAAREPRSSRMSTSRPKDASSRCRQGAVEVVWRPVQQLLRPWHSMHWTHGVMCASQPLFRSSAGEISLENEISSKAKTRVFYLCSCAALQQHYQPTSAHYT